MRSFGLLLVMAVGATIAVYTPLKDLYPPRHEVFALAVETVPAISDYIPDWLTLPPEADPASTAVDVSEDREPVEPVNVETNVDQPVESSVFMPSAISLWIEFESEELRLLLDEMGFTAEASVGDDGEEMVLVNRPQGLDFAVVLKACDGSEGVANCRALQVAAIVFQEIDDGVVASMNRRHDDMKFAKLDGGDLQITRYVTADYGIARDNVKANIAAFVDILDLYTGTG